MDGNSANTLITPSMMLMASAASLQLHSDPLMTVTLTAVVSDVGSASSSSRVFMTLYGSNGHVGPLWVNTDFSFSQGSTHDVTWALPNIGTFESMKLYNSGNDGLHLESLTLSLTPPGSTVAEARAWAVDAWLDGDGSSAAAPHADYWHAANALVVGSGQAMSVVHLATSFFADSDTTDDIFVTLIGSCGSSDERLIGGGVNQRLGLDVPIIHQDIGVLQGVQVRLVGNNAVHFAEIRVSFADGASEWTWMLSELNGWIDGDSESPSSRIYQTSTASPAVDGAANPLVNLGGSGCNSIACTICNGDCDNDSHCGTGLTCFQRSGYTAVPGCASGGSGDTNNYDYCHNPSSPVATLSWVTGTTSNAQSDSTFAVTVYGSLGHNLPISMGGSRANGETSSMAFSMGNIGTFFGMKIWNTGTDGWLPETLTLTIGSNSYSWIYGQWIDGNGSGDTAPHADFFYADGTFSSQPGLANTEINMACPDQFAACMANSACPGEMAVAIAANAVPATSAGVTLLLMQCVSMQIAGTWPQLPPPPAPACPSAAACTANHQYVTPAVDLVATDGVAGYNTYQLSVTLRGGAFDLHSIFGLPESNMVIPAAWQAAAAAGGVDIGGIAPAFLTAVPELTYDSWLTIGEVVGGSTVSTTISTTEFNSWSSSSGLTTAGGAVLYSDPAASPTGGTGIARIIVAQLTVSSSSPAVAVMNLGGHTQDRSSMVSPGEMTADWSATGVTFCLL